MTNHTDIHTDITPAPARTDVRPTRPAPVPRWPYLLPGALLSAGALAWAGAMAVHGVDPGETGTDVAVFAVCSGLFQLGLLGLLSVLHRTRALGTGRVARFFLGLEAVLVTFAIGSTVSDGIGTTDFDRVGFVLLDACWPLSMLGMFLIGVRVAIAGRWRGASRFWPLVAESWAVVVVPTVGIAGQDVAGVVATLHLVVGYTVLGVLVARKEG